MSRLDLKRFAIFADLAREELELVQGLLEASELRVGQQLFREGREADGMVLVDQGKLRFESSHAGDLGEGGPGTVLGALSLVAFGSRELSAKAEEPTRVYRLSRTAFHRLAEDYPRTAVRLLEAVLGEFAGLVRGGLQRLV